MLRSLTVRQPIIVRAVIAIAVVAGLRIGALFGWIPPDWIIAEDQVQDWIDYGIGILAFWSARRVVTPVAAPRDSAGRHLAAAPDRPREL